MGLGARLAEFHLAHRETDCQESGRLIVARFRSLSSKSVNNVCKLLQRLLGLCPWTPQGDFRPPDLLGYSRQIKIPDVAIDTDHNIEKTIRKPFEEIDWSRRTAPVAFWNSASNPAPTPNGRLTWNTGSSLHLGVERK